MSVNADNVTMSQKVKCVVMCVFKLHFLANPFPQISHLNGFSPVCVLTWSLKWYELLNLRSQNGHCSLNCTETKSDFVNKSKYTLSSNFLISMFVFSCSVCFLKWLDFCVRGALYHGGKFIIEILFNLHLKYACTCMF